MSLVNVRAMLELTKHCANGSVIMHAYLCHYNGFYLATANSAKLLRMLVTFVL